MRKSVLATPQRRERRVVLDLRLDPLLAAAGREMAIKQWFQARVLMESDMQFERAKLRSSRPNGWNCIRMSGTCHGKRNRVKEAKRQSAQSALAAVLRTHARRRDLAVTSYGDFDHYTYGRQIEAYRALALRAPETWCCRIKSNDVDRRFVELVRHTFARYRVPAHLERVWLDTRPAERGGGARDPADRHDR